MGRQPANPTRRVRRGRGHSYVLDGERALGVTTILGKGLPKPALVWWAGDTVAEYVMNRITKAKGEDGAYSADDLIDDLHEVNGRRTKPYKMSGKFPRMGLQRVLSSVHNDERDRAAKRGTEVHRIAAELAEGEEVEVPEELKGHVDSYLKFLEEWQPENALVEFTIINRAHGFMGTGDLLCEFPEPWGVTLLDVKTSKSGIYAENGLQVLAYGHGETYLLDDGSEEPLPEVQTYGAIWVRADGYDVYRLNVDESDYRVFRYIAEVARWVDDDDRSGSIVGEAEEAPPWA